MRTLSADVIYPANSAPIKNGVIQFDENGVILFVGSKDDFSGEIDEHLTGAICPGFINAHCHLELSFMFEQIPTHTGLLDFIGQVVQKREQFDEATQQQKIKSANQEMINNGIVAVGDISNDVRSFAVKEKSELRFHTFVELFDMEPSNTEANLQNGKITYEAAPKSNGNTASITPHAPYSCTPELVAFCDEFSASRTPILSIHNQEHPEENQYFMDKTGAWAQLFINWGVNQDWFKPQGTTSLQAIGQGLTKGNQVLFIHNTFTSKEDVEWADKNLAESYFCSCPNANLYIENKLPNYKELINAGAKLCLGTDSLASNWQLSILEEMKTIQSAEPQISTQDLVMWACWNGAKALRFNEQLGSLEKGKAPGLVHITNLSADLNLTPESKPIRLNG